MAPIVALVVALINVRKGAKNNSVNGESGATPDGELDDGLNVALEGAP